MRGDNGARGVVEWGVTLLRSLVVVLPLSGLVVAACSGSSSVEGTGGAGATGGKGGGAATGGSGGKGGAATGGKGAGGSGSGSAGKGSGGSGTSTGGTGGSGLSGEGGVPSSGGSAGTAGTVGIPLAQAPMQLANAVCAKAFECCTAEELMALSVIGQTEDQCRAAVAAFIGLYQANIQASIAAMRASYDGGALAGCVDEHETRACDDLPSFEEIGCAGAVVPLIAMGEACGAHHECIDGYCEGAGTSAATPTGTCAPKKADGETCVNPFECEGGACSTSTGCGPTTGQPLCGG